MEADSREPAPNERQDIPPEAASRSSVTRATCLPWASMATQMHRSGLQDSRDPYPVTMDTTHSLNKQHF